MIFRNRKPKDNQKTTTLIDALLTFPDSKIPPHKKEKWDKLLKELRKYKTFIN